jgi:hypothetical protein
MSTLFYKMKSKDLRLTYVDSKISHGPDSALASSAAARPHKHTQTFQLTMDLSSFWPASAIVRSYGGQVRLRQDYAGQVAVADTHKLFKRGRDDGQRLIFD